MTAPPLHLTLAALLLFLSFSTHLAVPDDDAAAAGAILLSRLSEDKTSYPVEPEQEKKLPLPEADSLSGEFEDKESDGFNAVSIPHKGISEPNVSELKEVKETEMDEIVANAGDERVSEDEINSWKREEKAKETYDEIVLTEKPPEPKTESLTFVNFHPSSRFRPVNRRFPIIRMGGSFPLRPRHRCHHQQRRFVRGKLIGLRSNQGGPLRALDADEVNRLVFQQTEIPARLINRQHHRPMFHDRNPHFPGDVREGMLLAEFKEPRVFFHHHRRHHHRDHDHDADRVEIEEKEFPEMEKKYEEKDDGVLMKIRKFLTQF
ncbi:hypothetical protein Dimus_003515 [Dionaea muscipula]